MKTYLVERRGFLKAATLALSAFSVPFIPNFAKAQSTATANNSPTANMRQIIDVSIRGDLFNPPTMLQLDPGAWSDPIHLPGRGYYRVRVVPGEVNPRYGQVFALSLANQDQKIIDSAKVGNGATETFGSYGIQVSVRSVWLPQ